jgi:prevent-host-death family protein
MPVYKIHEAKTHFSQLIEKARMGEEVIIAKGDEPVVRLTALSSGKKRKVGSARGQIRMSSDFDAPLTDFDEYS